MLQSNPKLNLPLKGIKTEQVKETELLGVTLDSHLSWSTHIDNITKIMERCAEFLTSTSVVQVIQALVLSHLDYCPAVWSGATKKDVRKLQVTQNKAHKHLHKCVSWLKVEQRLLASFSLFLGTCLSTENLIVSTNYFITIVMDTTILPGRW